MSILEPSGPRKWQQLEWDKDKAASLAQEFALSPAIAAMLLQRGHTDVDDVRRFLYPSLQDLPSPFLLKGMTEAVALAHEACVLGQPVLVYGDYDVDGTTGAAVLGIFLRRLGLQVHFCQPNRLADGYGLKAHLLEAAHGKYFHGISQGVLLVTVDCGITDHQPILRARELGFKVLVTDHHQPPPTPVPAHCIINPWQAGCDFSFKQLAGVGVAFFLIMGIRSHLAKTGFWKNGESPPNLREYLDLVALGTVADMVPLVGVNRILVKAGLLELEKGARPGIRALLEKSGIQDRRLGAEDISFRLGPRLNAAGRMGDPGRALTLLITEDSSEGEKYAAELENDNKRRKEAENELLQEVLTKIKNDGSKEGSAVIASGPGWHHGILGIVASKIMHSVFRPVILISHENGSARGSARSIPGIDLFGVLRHCDSLLETFGGHASAAGLSLKTSNIQKFKEMFLCRILDISTPDMFTPSLTIDCFFDEIPQIDAKFASDYFLMGPFGQGNKRPVLAGRTGQCMKNLRVVGENHLHFQWQGAGQDFNGIGFRFGHYKERLARENGLVAFSLHLNVFQGRERAEMQIEDILLTV
jgi:single-stranded-DNA-specific exonuclease